MLQCWMVDTDAAVLDGRYRCCSVGWVCREKDGCKTYADRWIKIWYIEEEIRRKNRSRKRDNRHKTQDTKHKTQLETARQVVEEKREETRQAGRHLLRALLPLKNLKPLCNRKVLASLAQGVEVIIHPMHQSCVARKRSDLALGDGTENGCRLSVGGAGWMCWCCGC
jgi:hypothetical protein